MITWIDGNDPIHQEERAKYLRTYKSRDQTATASYRWNNHNELYFSVLSALLFAPWLRYIFIVVSLGQRPVNLPESPKIRFVDDCEILPEKALPNFSSHSVESNLWRIPDLSERFLYSNDDMMFAAPVQPSDFFDANTGFPRLIPGDLLPVIQKPPHDFFPAWYAARCNNALLLNRFFGVARPARREAKHQIRSCLKSVFSQMWAIGGFRKVLEATTFSRFRSHRDIEPIGLSQQCAIQWGKRAPAGDLRCGYVSWYDNTNWDEVFRDLKCWQPQLLCINDEQQENRPESAAALQKYLEEWFANAAPEKNQCSHLSTIFTA